VVRVIFAFLTTSFPDKRMDPLTLFALANGAVTAVKKGCQLYKDIKGAAGDVKAVLKDLDEQFHNAHKDKPPSVEAKKQFLEEKERVKELNRKEPTDVYDEIGQHLSVYFENMAKCLAIFEEEEKRAQEVYSGDDSVGKRALQRVLMRKKLEQMGVELRELMVYQSPPELGALYTDVNEMMEKISKEQKAAISKKMKQDRLNEIKLAKRLERLKIEIAWGIGVLVIACSVGLMFAWVVGDRIKKYPKYGDGWIPMTEEERIEAAKPKIYIGR
jgi:hypothetical protein